MKVAILGCGSIGGSIALRLKNMDWEVIVNDIDKKIMGALKRKGIERFKRYQDVSADVLLLCLPMNVEEKMLKDLRFPNTVMDVSSTMMPFVEIARGKKLHFIGGHPMAGNEKKGLAGWDPSMFEERTFFLCKTPEVNDLDTERALSLVKALGADPILISAAKHDVIVSKISQSLFFLSAAARYIGGGFEVFAGPGYDSTVRLSKQNPEMVMDMVRYNRVNILKDLKEANEFLNGIIRLIERGNASELEKMFGGKTP